MNSEPMPRVVEYQCVDRRRGFPQDLCDCPRYSRLDCASVITFQKDEVTYDDYRLVNLTKPRKAT